ncbi:Splicing factor-like protein [Trema orientale]|uniref:Splicing factor-like protein n=1 Tax=Trema orientale TaxID=63057 RepID=A0A2P5CFQ3_TREOI|nr:Splicing factor-like protein [Trema orientale]
MEKWTKTLLDSDLTNLEIPEKPTAQIRRSFFMHGKHHSFFTYDGERLEETLLSFGDHGLLSSCYVLEWSQFVKAKQLMLGDTITVSHVPRIELPHHLCELITYGMVIFRIAATRKGVHLFGQSPPRAPVRALNLPRSPFLPQSAAQVVIRGIPERMNCAELRELFHCHGRILDLAIYNDAGGKFGSGTTRIGLLTYATEEEADIAIKALDRYFLELDRLRLHLSHGATRRRWRH